MTVTVDDCMNHLTAHRDVVALGRCGSARLGITDAYSDLDIWVFCADAAPLSEVLVLDGFLPAAARAEVLIEGRNDHLVDHLVVNILTGDVILNLKFLHLEVFTGFVQQAPTLDASYLEDLENYQTMEVLHDPHGLVKTHQAWLQTTVADATGTWLAPDLASRYASTYWRSVYQGVLRDEGHAWRHLATTLLEILAWTSALNDGRPPTPRKWLFSPRLLTHATGGTQILALLDLLHATDAHDDSSVLAFYAELAPLEELLFTDPALHGGYWWRSVFTRRIPNLAAITDLGGLPSQIAAAAIPPPRP